MAQSPVTAVEISDNAKLGKISATMASQVTCPKSCPLYNNGCYAQSGRANLTTSRLNQSEIKSPLAVIKIHAEQIRKLSGRRMLRLNVVGDCDFEEGAKILAQAAKEHTEKCGMPVFTYTHGHETKRESWGDISVLRSCETISQVEKAHADGFASAMVVEKHESAKAVKHGDFTLIPCPQQVGTKNNCADCKLCSKDRLLHKQKMVITFAIHGAREKRAKEILNSIHNAS
jgi:hypothetical protein